MKKKEFHVVREEVVKTPDSLLTMAAGTKVEVPCKVFAGYTTVASAATRLNQRAGWKEFEVSSPDNGATIVIKRNAKPTKAARQ